MKLTFKNNDHCTHQPVLIATVRHLSIESNVLELGTGIGSTELLHMLCKDKHNLMSVDHDSEWLNRYEQQFECSNPLKDGSHTFKLLQLDDILKDYEIINTGWDLVFIDQGSWKSREDCVLYFKDKAKYIILHDSDPYADPFGTALGDQIEPLIKNEKPGISDFSKTFKYWKEFYPPLPWAAPTGPPTLLGSNFYSVGSIQPDWNMEEII